MTTRLTIRQAIELLRTPGTGFCGSDWKHGWPHKFYVGNGKVYNYQLMGSSDAELLEYSALTEKFFGVKFYRVDDEVRWNCPYPGDPCGYQRAGTVGESGEPLRSDSWSVDFMVN